MNDKTRETVLADLMGTRDKLERQCRKTVDSKRLVFILTEGFRNMGMDDSEYVVSCFKALEIIMLSSENYLKEILAIIKNVYQQIKGED